MRVIDFSPERGVPITEFASRAASARPLGAGRGEVHAKESTTGCSAVMVQIAELTAPGDALA